VLRTAGPAPAATAERTPLAVDSSRSGTASGAHARSAVSSAARRVVEVPVVGVRLDRVLRAVWPVGQRPAGPARDLLAIAGRPA
jgi:hypothetical protein